MLGGTRNHTPTEQPAAEIPASTESATTLTTEQAWESRSHEDDDMRIPGKLREQLRIGPHETYSIQVVESSDSGFILKVSKKSQ